MQDCKVNILGAEWEIVQRDEKADVNLDGKFRDGYTDISTHTTSSQRYLNIKNNVVVGYKGRKTSEKELDVEKKRFYVRRHVLIRLIPRRMS